MVLTWFYFMTIRPKWKLSDFVLAKYSPMRETSYFSTEIMGTFGYAAPEYESTGTFYQISFTNWFHCEFSRVTE